MMTSSPFVSSMASLALGGVLGVVVTLIVTRVHTVKATSGNNSSNSKNEDETSIKTKRRQRSPKTETTPMTPIFANTTSTSTASLSASASATTCISPKQQEQQQQQQQQQQREQVQQVSPRPREFNKEQALCKLRDWLFQHGGQLDIPSLVGEYCCLVRRMGVPLDRFFVGSSFQVSKETDMSEIPFVGWKWLYENHVHHHRHAEQEHHNNNNNHDDDDSFWQNSCAGAVHHVEEQRVPRQFHKDHIAAGSPFALIQEKMITSMRMRASPDLVPPSDCGWFIRENYQDYLALPMKYKDEVDGALAWSTKQDGGFSDAQIEFLQDSLNAISTVLRLHSNDFTVRLLTTNLEQQVAQRTSELQVANQQLQRAAVLMKEQQAAQMQHFAMMSHELRTPLNGLIGMTSILLHDITKKDEEIKPEELKDSLEMIASSGDLLRGVVDDVLDYSKLSAGKMETIQETILVHETAGSVVRAIEIKGKSKNIMVRSHWSANLPRMAQTDGRRLQMILFNVLGNAVKFSPNNSVIDFHVSLEQGGTGKKETQYLQFVVKDYGKGIPAEECPHIFEPFRQVNRGGWESEYGGTGLGLSITSKIVEALGGSITVESQVNQFSEFTVRIPYHKACCDALPQGSAITSDNTKLWKQHSEHSTISNTTVSSTEVEGDQADSVTLQRAGETTAPQMPCPGSATRTTANAARPLSDLRILMAEDNKINQRVLKAMLGRLGIQHLDIVINGQEAVDRSNACEYDIILMDFEMPKMNGLEATRIITERCKKQSHPQHCAKRSPRIVFLTAHALTSFRSQAADVGADSFLSKPYKLEEIREMLQGSLVSTPATWSSE